MKIVVMGGSGFLRKEICKLASARGISVISVSRNGKPGSIKEKEFENVEWIAVNIFEPQSWKMHLAGTGALIHCIGIIEENVDKGITYEKMILMSAKVACDEAIAAGVPKFVFISAGAAAPETPETYMKMKIATEGYLINSQRY